MEIGFDGRETGLKEHAETCACSSVCRKLDAKVIGVGGNREKDMEDTERGNVLRRSRRQRQESEVLPRQ